MAAGKAQGLPQTAARTRPLVERSHTKCHQLSPGVPQPPGVAVAVAGGAQRLQGSAVPGAPAFKPGRLSPR